jgi:hypothetical protein
MRLYDRDGRKAERPLLRPSAIQHDVVWPKAAEPLSATKIEKADLRRTNSNRFQMILSSTNDFGLRVYFSRPVDTVGAASSL